MFFYHLIFWKWFVQSDQTGSRFGDVRQCNGNVRTKVFLEPFANDSRTSNHAIETIAILVDSADLNTIKF